MMYDDFIPFSNVFGSPEKDRVYLSSAQTAFLVKKLPGFSIARLHNFLVTKRCHTIERSKQLSLPAKL